jgi:hypothetical protein
LRRTPGGPDLAVGEQAIVNPIIYSGVGESALQPILSTSSAFVEGEDGVRPHHPVTCSDNLRYDDDGVLMCDHAAVPADDRRTRFCLHYSVSLLLIELLDER